MLERRYLAPQVAWTKHPHTFSPPDPPNNQHAPPEGDGQGPQSQVCPRGRSRTEGPLSPTQGRSSFPSDKLRTYKQIKSQANLSDGRQSQSAC